MINVFNSPIEAAHLDEFHEENNAKGDDAVFDSTRKRPKVSYTTDGRKVVDGVVSDELAPNALWAATISRGVANEWREKAEGGRIAQARRYLESFSYECRVILNRSCRQYATQLLLLLNVALIVVVLYLFNLIIW